MPVIAPAVAVIHPSYTMPELLLPYSQASGAFATLPRGDAEVRLGEGDLAAYINRIDVRTKVAAGQAAYNQLPSCDVVLSLIKTPTYLMRVRAEYDHHDTAAMARRGVSIVQAQRLAMRQGHFQQGRVALLYGFNPQNGEGLINANGATSVPLPADQYGNTTVTTYDNGSMAFFLINQWEQIKVRTNQLGIGRTVVILGPQRVLGTFAYNVVQLVQYQRVGAGSTSTAGVVKAVSMDNGDTVIWAYDDTLIGKGAAASGSPTDAVLMVMPEVEKPQGSTWNTNEFAKLAPGLEACTLQLCDMAAPREIPTPLPGGAIDVLSEMRITSGWGVRPEAITVISMPYP
jgi:hypothetical protein